MHESRNHGEKNARTNEVENKKKVKRSKMNKIDQALSLPTLNPGSDNQVGGSCCNLYCVPEDRKRGMTSQYSKQSEI